MRRYAMDIEEEVRKAFLAALKQTEPSSEHWQRFAKLVEDENEHYKSAAKQQIVTPEKLNRCFSL